MNYNDPDMTLRAGVEASLGAVNDQVADLDALIETTQTRIASVFDPVTSAELKSTLVSMRGRKTSLDAEASRLQAVLDGWDAEAAA